MAETYTAKIEYVPIEKLVLLDRNPRTIKDTNFKKLCDSLKRLPGYFHARPCLANNASGELVVYAGNMRLRAAREIGLKEVPCIIEKLSVKEQRERAIRDNVELGEWDFDLLSSDYEKEELDDMGVPLICGFDEVEENESDEIVEASNIILQIEFKSKKNMGGFRNAAGGLINKFKGQINNG